MKDHQLITALQGNQKQQDEAILWILAHWWSDVKAFIKSCGAEEQFVEDIAQEALAGLTQQVRKENFKGDSALLTYFKQIARFKTIDYLKKYAPTSSSVNILPELPEENYREKQELQEEINYLHDQLVKQLDETCQKLMTLRKSEYSMKEIAREMGWKEQTANNNVSKCREKLRELGEQHPSLLTKIKELL
jgi:RNA polymerase sigma factor (sigma-70 family)